MPADSHQLPIDYTPLEQKFSLLGSLRTYAQSSKWNLAKLCLYAGLVAVILSFALLRQESFYLIYCLVLAAIGYSLLRSWARSRKMQSFAIKNQLRFIKDNSAQHFEGMIFDLGHTRRTTGYILERPTLSGIVANYSYVTGHGKNQRKHSYGFVRIELPRQLPHMVLDARKNNFLGISSLARSFKSGQRLELEGDFNQHFTLYAPKAYERDALYVFTPDIMQLLVDKVADYDVEIVGNSLFVYSSRRLQLADRAELENLLDIASKLSAKFDRRVDYYADERINDRSMDMIAQSGRRLKGSPSVLVILLIAAVGMIWLWPSIQPVLEQLLGFRVGLVQ